MGDRTSPTIRQRMHWVGALWMVAWPILAGFAIAHEEWGTAAILAGFWVGSVSLWIVTHPSGK